MVNGLITHYKLGLGAMSNTGLAENITFLKGEQLSTESFNPLLLAIAHKKLDIVRYFLYDMHVSLKNFGKKPFTRSYNAAENADNQTYCLQIAVANKDQAMLEELWNVYNAWDYLHLQKIVDIIVEEKWAAGL